MKTAIPVENGDTLAAVRGFLLKLLETGTVEALLVPLEVDGGAVLPALVTDPERVRLANPLAPVMPINNARAVSALTGKHAPARIGAVLRPCEIRALVELVKLQQATLEGVTLIGVDCTGTFEVPDYVAKKRGGGAGLADYLAGAKEGAEPGLEDLKARQACQMCLNPVPEHTAIHLELIGVDSSQAIPVTITDEIAGKLGMTETSLPEGGGRQAALERLLAGRTQARQRELAAIQAQMNANGGLASLFATCIRCHNCMTACPICYCKTCLFKSASFDHKPDHYLNAARRKGAVRLLSDAMLFQVTRMNHMSTSCVSCGMCTSACPSDIPVGAIFSAIGSQVQAAFEYVPGRSLEEPLPLVTFRESEWTEVGEAK
jgi:formate dehydrogenase subunit beta